MNSIHDRQFIDNHPELIAEKLDVNNVARYQIVFDSIKYICSYSGYNPDECKVIDEIINPELPKNGVKENNYIYGIYETSTNEAVAWIQYYLECDNKPIAFLGELFVRKEYQKKAMARQFWIILWKFGKKTKWKRQS